MKYPLILTRAFFATLTIFLSVPVTSGTDCTPHGQWLADEVSPQCNVGEQQTRALSKTGHWNITWPDGHQELLQPTGSGECTYNWDCSLFAGFGATNCWPLFHQPVRTSEGGFDILVESQVTQPQIRSCPHGLTSQRSVFCNVSRRSVTTTAHTCPNSGGGGCPDGQIPPECDPGQSIDFENCCCVAYDGGPCVSSPILVDVLGDGFKLTEVARGVTFDLNDNGNPKKVSWTAAGSDDSWLVLDRNGNRKIDTGAELFGNHTPQSLSTVGKNGFLALGDFDNIQSGGNGDGAITQSDGVFSLLRLWQDVNHNGISESVELKTLSDLGLAQLELTYKNSRKVDEYGNLFRYRAKVKDVHGAQVGRWAWDVFLMTAP